MKKLLTLLLTLFMVFTLVGCNSKEDTPVIQEPEKQEEVVEETKEEPEIVGGYVDVEDGTLTDELKDIFDSALEGLLGATYEPVELVATQVVAGTNYKFLANGTKTTNPVTKGTYYITIYKDLEGNVELLDIETIQEKQEEIKTADSTQYSYWVVTYDQFDNEISRTTAKYGTTIKDPDGNDVVVKGNTYFHTTIDYFSNDDEQTSTTEDDEFVDNNPMTMSQMSEWFGENVDKAVKLNDDGNSYTLTGGKELVPNPLYPYIGTEYYEELVSYCIKINEDLVLPSSIDGKPVTAIEQACFSSVQAKSVVIPNTVETIGNSAFSNNLWTSNIEIPNSVETIGEYAFANGMKNMIIFIPSSVSSIGMLAFEGKYVCNNSLENASGAIVQDVSSIKNDFLLCDNDKKVYTYFGNNTNATLPEGVETLCDLTGSNVTEITICSTLNKIEEGMYSNTSFNTIKFIFGSNNSWRKSSESSVIEKGVFSSLEEALNYAVQSSSTLRYDLIRVDN